MLRIELLYNASIIDPYTAFSIKSGLIPLLFLTFKS